MNVGIVEAIKIVRSLCPGMGLKEAVKHVETEFPAITAARSMALPLKEVVLLAHKTAVEWAAKDMKSNTRLSAVGDVVVVAMTLEEARIATALFGALTCGAQGDEVYHALREYLAARNEVAAELEDEDGEDIPVLCVKS